MKKKEVLIIFILAVLVTGLSWWLTPYARGRHPFRGSPLPFLIYSSGSLPFYREGEWDGLLKGKNWRPTLLMFDLLFWFLVLAALYHVGYRVKRWVKKKLRGGKMKAEVFKNEKS